MGLTSVGREAKRRGGGFCLRRFIYCLSCYLDEGSTLVWWGGTSKYICVFPKQWGWAEGGLHRRVNISLLGNDCAPETKLFHECSAEKSKVAGFGQGCRWAGFRAKLKPAQGNFGLGRRKEHTQKEECSVILCVCEFS